MGVVNVLVSSKLSVALVCAHGGKIDQFAVLIFAGLFFTEIIQLSGDFRQGDQTDSFLVLCVVFTSSVFVYFLFNAQRSDKF